MRLLSQFPGSLVCLRRGETERIILGEAEILQPLLKPQQVVDMREQGLIKSRGLVGREIVARHATSLTNGVAPFLESQDVRSLHTPNSGQRAGSPVRLGRGAAIAPPLQHRFDTTGAGHRVSRRRPAIGHDEVGLIPSWADDPKIGYSLINARSERPPKSLRFDRR
jgi:hypothetical protein